MPLTIKVRRNGPYFIDLSTSDVQLLDADGNPIAIPSGKPGITRCRCGESKNKPFGDGAHKTYHFDERAQAPAPQLAPPPGIAG